ncbi:MAG: AtpZ/AtpI family protein [bacterium]|nr:AtpZ/AtpI family protein [bacterium]
MIKKEWPLAMQLLGVGFYVAFSIVLPTTIGFYLDSRGAHSIPVYTLGGLVLGTVVMIFGVYKMVRPYLQEAKRVNQDKEKANSEKTEKKP